MKTLLMIALSMLFAWTAYGNDVCGQGYKADGTVKERCLKSTKVKNVSGRTLTLGTVVVLDTTTNDGIAATITLTQGARPHCVLMAACSSNAMCQCLQKGYFGDLQFYNDGVGARGPATAGKIIWLSQTLQGYAEAHGSGGETISDWKIGVYLENKASTAAADAFIDL